MYCNKLIFLLRIDTRDKLIWYSFYYFNTVLTNMPQTKCLPLEEYQQLCLDLDRIRRETANLHQKLCHARRNLEEEKRKRRTIEHHKNLLESQISMAKKVLFHDREVNLNEDIRKKLEFLNKSEIEFKSNNLTVQDKWNDRHLTTITETDSTGSILSDLNCLSKSEDDLDTDTIIKVQREKKWKEYKPSDEYFMNKQCGTLDKIVEFKSSDEVTAKMKAKDSACSVPVTTQIASNKENIDSKLSKVESSSANHSFISKIVIKPETCTPCGKRIRFGKIALKCRDCPVTCHTECKIQVTLVSCECRKSATLFGGSVSTVRNNNTTFYVLLCHNSYFRLSRSKCDARKFVT
ncbi:PREDICTED: rac GTPase-activating protein 1-like isoform X1 [Trachymyrmex cornetzi]|uniref:rac GTPase-activating protein 1-like isoform X1 n=2 Tax=Trachymyrmex cornetzi TaxID=471704 RepID=UPI00084F2746|nr:PREDICTED: rac GTPase-activating protein 1-like isoform X1 [Trachymyrmex cornetzi]